MLTTSFPQEGSQRSPRGSGQPTDLHLSADSPISALLTYHRWSSGAPGVPSVAITAIRLGDLQAWRVHELVLADPRPAACHCGDT